MINVRRYLTAGVLFRLVIIMAGFFVADAAMAASTYVTLTTIQKNVGSSVSNLARVLEDLALVCGIGFILASFFKFHQHKLNPTQVPMSQGVTLLIIGAGLSIFPHLLDTVSQSVFGTSVQKLGGTAITGVIGS